MARKTKKKSPGAPKKAQEDKSIRRDFTLKGEVVALIDSHKTFGFKSGSGMVAAAVVALSRQYAAKIFQANLIPDKNGVM